MLEISKKLIKVIQGLIFFSHVMLVKRFQYLSIYQEIHEIGLAFLLLLTLNRLGGGTFGAPVVLFVLAILFLTQSP